MRDKYKRLNWLCALEEKRHNYNKSSIISNKPIIRLKSIKKEPISLKPFMSSECSSKLEGHCASNLRTVGADAVGAFVVLK